jgi:hypothetical protein
MRHSRIVSRMISLGQFVRERAFGDPLSGEEVSDDDDGTGGSSVMEMLLMKRLRGWHAAKCRVLSGNQQLSGDA